MTSESPRPPKPHDYLAAGLPVAGDFGGELRGTLEQGVQYLRSGVRDARHSEFIVVDEEGAPIATVALASPSRFLTAPRTEKYLGDGVTVLERRPNGYRHVEFAGDPHPQIRDERLTIDRRSARAVTIDTSVLVAGADKSLFGPKDVLFLSSELYLDFAMFSSPSEREGTLAQRTHYRHWHDSVPVPLHAGIIDIFRRIAHLADRSIDRTDVVCAAMAIYYKVPLYTRTPEIYESMKNGLRTIEYGPVRNRTVSRDQRETESTGTTERPLHKGSPAEVLLKGYHAGRRFDTRYSNLLTADEEPTAMAQFVDVVLGDTQSNVDTSWRMSLLNASTTLAPILARDDQWHADIMLDLAQLTVSNPFLVDYSIQEQSDRAFIAIGQWGRWPGDASEEIIGDLIQNPSDRFLLDWYRAFMWMAGVPRGPLQTEYSAILRGERLPSLQRIEELRSDEPR